MYQTFDVIAFFLVCICYLTANSIPKILDWTKKLKHVLEKKSKKPVADGREAGSKNKAYGGNAGSNNEGQVHVGILMFDKCVMSNIYHNVLQMGGDS